MADDTHDADLKFINEYLARWNRHDVEGIVEMMTPDCVFDSSMGPDVFGRRFVGHDEMRQGIERLIKGAPQFTFSDVSAFVHGDRAVAEWTMTHTAPDGSRVSVRGCDLFRLRDGKICYKDSYRKSRAGAEYHGVE